MVQAPGVRRPRALHGREVYGYVRALADAAGLDLTPETLLSAHHR